MKTIGKYVIRGLLGRGAMGRIYKVEHPVIGKIAALKMLAPNPLLVDLMGWDRLEAMFTAEAVTLADKAEADVEKMKAIYDERRKYMVSRLRELGFGLTVEPSGAFYMLVNAKHLAEKSYDLAFEILEKAGVGVSPGIDFGQNAEGYLRFSYANSIENIRKGLERLESFLR